MANFFFHIQVLRMKTVSKTRNIRNILKIKKTPGDVYIRPVMHQNTPTKRAQNSQEAGIVSKVVGTKVEKGFFKKVRFLHFLSIFLKTKLLYGAEIRGKVANPGSVFENYRK